jgi:hypothetical protein
MNDYTGFATALLAGVGIGDLPQEQRLRGSKGGPFAIIASMISMLILYVRFALITAVVICSGAGKPACGK